MSEGQEVRDFSGEIVDAVCESVDGRRVLFSLGDGERAYVDADELHGGIPSIGDHVELYVEGLTTSGLWAASADMLGTAILAARLDEARRKKMDLDVTVVSAGQNGLVCDVCSLMGFMPRREIDVSLPAELNTYVGQHLKARILKFSMADGRLIVSHRAAVEQEVRAAREKFLAALHVGQVYEGTVRQITDFGAFVDIGAGVEGLAHRSNLSWENDEPANIVSVGDTIKVQVLALENGKIALGHKQLTGDPWAVAAGRIHVGDVVEGKVTTFANFGAFVRIDGGIEGLIHNSELSWDSDNHTAKQILKLNDTVKSKVLEINPEQRRLRLSLRHMTENPWLSIADEYPAGSRHSLEISGIAEFGLFVELGRGLRGLIHRNDICWTGLPPALNTTYKIGDKVECVVLGVDPDKERASLGIKQLTTDPYAEFIAQKPVGKQFEATIKRITRFGAFAAIGEVEGLIHISEMSENRIESVASVLKVGQTVTVTVLNIDAPRRRIGLSLIAEPFEPSDGAGDADGEKDGDETEKPSRPTLADIIPDDLKNRRA